MGASRYKCKEKLLISIDLEATMNPYTPRAGLPIRALADHFRSTHLFPGSILKSGKGYLVTVVTNLRACSRITNK